MFFQYRKKTLLVTLLHLSAQSTMRAVGSNSKIVNSATTSPNPLRFYSIFNVHNKQEMCLLTDSKYGQNNKNDHNLKKEMKPHSKKKYSTKVYNTKLNRDSNNYFEHYGELHVHIDNSEVYIASRWVGPYQMNQYFIICRKTKEAALIDSGLQSPTTFIELAEREGAVIRHLIQTHGHIDHVCGLKDTKKLFPDAPIYLHPLDKPLYEGVKAQGARNGLNFIEVPPQWDIDLKDIKITKNEKAKSKIVVGKIEFEVLHTPGHSPGHCCLFNNVHKILFAGDLLFQGSIGRTDLPLCNQNDMLKSLARIKTLPDQTIVFPGHMGTTTIGNEKRTNTFLRNL